ncbi:hypothetical protein QFZ63_005360 [Streptomyces sp. B3I7]|nr:hypothetical protein [Streptomyces sp. B3I7]
MELVNTAYWARGDTASRVREAAAIRSATASAAIPAGGSGPARP